MKYINIHTHRAENNSNTISILNIDDINTNIETDKLYSIGIHPWQINNINNIDSILQDIEEKLEKYKNIIAVGEIGLDKNIDTTYSKQLEVFNHQAKIAEKHGRPIIIHSVRAYSEFQQLIKKFSTSFIFHNFNSSEQTANSLLKHNAYFSFGKQFLHSKKTQEIYLHLPLSNTFFETDASATSIKEIYKFASNTRNIKESELINQTYNNFKKLFPQYV